MTWWEQAIAADVLLNILLAAWLWSKAAKYRRRERAVRGLKEMGRRAA